MGDTDLMLKEKLKIFVNGGHHTHNKK